MRIRRLLKIVAPLFVVASGVAVIGSSAQDLPRERSEAEGSRMNLRKTVGVREYKGKQIEGENRLIGPGDSLWRILIREKGLPEKRFSQYVVVVRGLNPQMKSPNILKIGDNLFIPLRPDELVEGGAATGQGKPRTGVSPVKGTTKPYRVKRGDHLYQILREQLGITDERELAVYYALTKDLNPEKKEWDFLREGESIQLPMTREASRVASAPGQAATPDRFGESTTLQSESKRKDALAAPAGGSQAVPPAKGSKPTPLAPAETVKRTPLDHALRLPARENLPLINQVVNALGSEFQSSGEEIFALSDGTVRVDKSAYPVVYSPRLQQRVVIDPQDNIPATLKTKLEDPRVAAPVLSLAQGDSLQAAVNQLLSQLGYQPLPNDRPVVIQEGGIAYEARGNWMALAPQESNKPQEILVITLIDHGEEIPDYLKTQLARNGLQLRDVAMPPSGRETSVSVNSEPQKLRGQTKSWPRDKRELVDALLLAYGISFGVSEAISVELRQGLRVEKRADRVFNLRGMQTALFFQRVGPEIGKALEEKSGTKVIELDLAALAPRETIARLLGELGETESYRQHRFLAVKGDPERLNISAWGFLLKTRSMFLTDREIPEPLQRFFFEKGLDIVYFQ